MKRKIHLIACFLNILLYISIALIVNAYFKTTLSSKQPSFNTYRVQWLISIFSILVLSLSFVATFTCGIKILTNLNNSSQQFRKLNIITGILYLFGGVFLAPCFSIFLYLKE